MNIKVNGKDVNTPVSQLTYDALCFLARVDPANNPSATYRLPNGASGVVRHGNPAQVVEGAKYSVYHTGLS